MTPAFGPKYIPSKYDNAIYKDDWYDPYDSSNNWSTYVHPPTAQITAQTTLIPQFNATTQTMATTSYMTTSQPITVTFAGTIDQAAVDAITHQLKVSLSQQQAIIDPPTPQRKRGPLEFNKYINGSDLVEEFIRYCGTLGVRQGEVLDIPIDSFIKWLIIEACVVDHEEPEVTLELGPSPQPRCLGCGRYVARSLGVPLHNERCAGFHFARQRKQTEVAHVHGQSTRSSDSDDRRILSGVGASGT